MDLYHSPKKFTFKIKNCNCSCHETMVRKAVKKIGGIELLSIDFENNTYTVCTTKCPTHVIWALQTLLHKEIKLLHDEEYYLPAASATAARNITHSAHNGMEIIIRFDIPKDGSGSGSSRGYKRIGGYGDDAMIGYDLPPSLPPPSPPWKNIRPSAPMMPLKEAYGYAVSTPPRYYYYYGTSTSSDDYTKDYPCTIM